MLTDIPLSLYIHIPWCLKKCPYCDFLSTERQDLSTIEPLYLEALLNDLEISRALLSHRSFRSVFFGGGTPSLLPPRFFGEFLECVNEKIGLSSDVEISMEINPGTVTQRSLKGYANAGINRFSIGVQSFNDVLLKRLHRIHTSIEAKSAIEWAYQARIKNLGIDLMYGLPDQTLKSALDDLKVAVDLGAKHLSWYELTLEHDTPFGKNAPEKLPNEETLFQIQAKGAQFLKEAGFLQYEVSAFARKGFQSLHNRNYWEFGDYLGIGAGAHSKITQKDQIWRFARKENVNDYLKNAFIETKVYVTEKELPFEFMFNGLRLTDGVLLSFFEERTNLSLKKIANMINEGIEKGLLVQKNNKIFATKLGQTFLNECILLFHSENLEN